MTATAELEIAPEASRTRSLVLSRGFLWLSVCVAIGATALLMLAWFRSDVAWDWEYLAWFALALGAGLGPVYATQSTQTDLDFPILVAASVVLGPVSAGVIALLVPDVRDLRGESTFVAAVFNRSLKTMCVTAAGLAAALIEVPAPLGIVVAAIVALFVDWALDLALVAAATRIERGVPVREFLRDACFGMPEGLVSYWCFGLLSIPLIAMTEWNAWLGCLVFVPVLLIARQALLWSSQVEKAGELLESRDRALRGAHSQMIDERADERLTIAAALHDEVLQSLHFLTLHAHVIEEDLRSGRLLQLEEDVPALLKVSQDASEVTRQIVGELRRSPLGSDGFRSTLLAQISRLQAEYSGRIDSDVDDLSAEGADAQLLTYQICREALTNAVKHSGAKQIWVVCLRGEKAVTIRIVDDGAGFDPERVDEARHFGLSLLKERTRAFGGRLEIRSRVGAGCEIEALVPARPA